MRLPSALLVLPALFAAASAPARTTAIDDAATLPYDSQLLLHWEQPAPRPPVDNRMTGTMTLHVKLNVAPWLRHSGRIYMVLPAQPSGPVSASWVTQARLLPGRLVSGSRALVYSGPITSAYLEDVLQLTIELDGTQLREPNRVSFSFEMDEP